MIRTVIFSIALIIAAAILGYQVKQVGGGRETISVKGLAEKPIKADRAEWTIRLQVKGATIAEALGKLRKERPALDQFLATAGFDKAAVAESNESAEPNYEQVESCQRQHALGAERPRGAPVSHHQHRRHRQDHRRRQGHRAVRGGRPPGRLR